MESVFQDLKVLVSPNFQDKSVEAWLKAKLPNQYETFDEYGPNVKIKDDLKNMDRYFVYFRDPDNEDDEVEESSRIMELPNLSYSDFLKNWLLSKSKGLTSEIEITILDLKRSFKEVIPYLFSAKESLEYFISHVNRTDFFLSYNFIALELKNMLEYVDIQINNSNQKKIRKLGIVKNPASSISEEEFKEKIDDLFDKLSATGFIRTEQSVKVRLQQLFHDENLDVKINWLKDRQDLRYFIIQLQDCNTVKFKSKRGVWQFVSESFLVKENIIDPIKIRKDHAPLQDVQKNLNLAIEKLGCKRHS